MRLYTGKGDGGETDLLGARVGKDDPRIELIGSLDEASSSIGLGRAHARAERTRSWLIDVQRDLYAVMAELAFTVNLKPAGFGLQPDRVDAIAAATDALSDEIALPPRFILPGDSVAGAALDVARTVVRRAERHAVAMEHAGGAVGETTLRYLNRLSSLLFMLARAEDAAAGVTPLPAKMPPNRGVV